MQNSRHDRRTAQNYFDQFKTQDLKGFVISGRWLAFSLSVYSLTHTLGKVRFFIGGGGGGGGGLGLFGCIVFSKVLTLLPGPAKEKHDPSQKMT